MNVKLLTIEEVQRGLDAEFLPLEPGITGLRLVGGGASPEALEQVQSRLNFQFPEAFRRVVCAFDLGDLSIGPVSFCGTGDYLSELVQLNKDVTWWGPGEKPADRRMVANSDPYAFLLNGTSGRVSAFDQERGWSNAVDIAEDFESFIRGLGTIMLLRTQVTDREALARKIAKEVGAVDQEFWHFLAR
jgi:hypothetical protein